MDNQITTMQEVTPTTQKAYDTHARILANGQVMARALVDVCHDLKTMRDEGLYTELGYDTFEEYAEQACGIKQRQAYSYISAYEKLGQKYMADHADLGITKLELISQISSYEREEFTADVDLESATVRELKAEVERYKKQTEQLTFDLGQAQSELSEVPEPVDTDTLRSSIEQEVKAKYSAQLEELQQRADAAPDRRRSERKRKRKPPRNTKLNWQRQRQTPRKGPKPLWKNWSRKRQTWNGSWTVVPPSWTPLFGKPRQRVQTRMWQPAGCTSPSCNKPPQRYRS